MPEETWRLYLEGEIEKTAAVFGFERAEDEPLWALADRVNRASMARDGRPAFKGNLIRSAVLERTQ